MLTKSDSLYFGLFILFFSALFLFIPLPRLISNSFFTVLNFSLLFSLIFYNIEENKPSEETLRITAILLIGFLGGTGIVFTGSFLMERKIEFSHFSIFLINIIPGIILLTVLKIILKHWIKIKWLRTSTTAFIFAGSFIPSYFQFVSGPGSVCFNIFTGLMDFGALGDQAGFTLLGIIFLNRIFTFVIALTLLMYLESDISNALRKVSAGLFCIVLIGVFLSPGHFGFGSDNGRMDYIANVKRNSEHFKIHFINGVFSRNEIRYIKDELEWNYRMISEITGETAKKRYDIYLINNNNFLKGGPGDNLYMFPSSDRSYLICFRDKILPHILSLRHEMVHMLTSHWFEGILPSIPRAEGLAVALSENYHRGPDYHPQLKFCSSDNFYTNLGFLNISKKRAYKLAGSFTGFLIFQYGMDNFQRYLKKGAKTVYGKSFNNLKKEWLEFLKKRNKSNINNHPKNNRKISLNSGKNLKKSWRKGEIKKILKQTKDKNDIESLFFRTLAFRKRKNFKKAKKLLKKIIEDNGLRSKRIRRIAFNLGFILEDWNLIRKTVKMEKKLTDNLFRKDLSRVVLSVVENPESRKIVKQALNLPAKEKYEFLRKKKYPALSMISSGEQIRKVQKKYVPDKKNYYFFFYRVWRWEEDFLPWNPIYRSYKPFLKMSRFDELRGEIYRRLGILAYLGDDYDTAETFMKNSHRLFKDLNRKTQADEWIKRIQWKKRRIQ